MWMASIQDASNSDELWLNTEKETNDTMICLKTRSEQLQEIPFPTNTSTLTASENGGV
jgi:hypothetical protein